MPPVEEVVVLLREALRLIDEAGDPYEVGPFIDQAIARLDCADAQGSAAKRENNVIEFKSPPDD